MTFAGSRVARVAGTRAAQGLTGREVDMSRKTLLAGAGFVLFTALPLLTPGDEVRAYPLPRVEPGPGEKGCVILEPGDNGGLSLLNPTRTSTPYTATYNLLTGTTTISSTGLLSGAGSAWLPTPDGFAGSVRLESDRLLAAIVQTYSGANADSPGSAYPCVDPIGTTSANYPILTGGQDLVVWDMSGSGTEIDLWSYSDSGAVKGPFPKILTPRQIRRFAARTFGVTNSTTPGTGQVFSFNPDSFGSATVLQDGSVLPGVDAARQDNSWYLPLLPHPLVGDYRTQCSAHNASFGPQTITRNEYDQNGNVIATTEHTIPSWGLLQWSSLVTSAIDALATEIVGTGGTSGNCMYNGIGGGQRAAKGSGAWASLGASSLITRRGYGFGAASTQQSKVSVMLRNVGKKKTKVKLRIFNGDTGKKVQSAAASIAAGATAMVAYKKRARGNNLYVEITVKGKGTVAAWLMRNFKGDVDFYPAVPR